MKPRQLKWEDIAYKTEPLPFGSDNPDGTRIYASLKGLGCVSHTIWRRRQPYVEDAIKPLMVLELQKKLVRHIEAVRQYLEP